jgi:phosphomannomutase
MTHQFHPTVLREYDIRGIIGETLGEEDARAIGRGFGTLLRACRAAQGGGGL